MQSQNSTTITSTEAALRTLIAEQEQAWNRGDAVAWCAAFSDDASFISVRGDELIGRKAIEDRHRMIFGGPYKGTHTIVSVGSIKLLVPDVALIETVHAVTQFATLPPGVVATEPGVLRTRMKYVAVKHGQSWQFVAAQNTATLPGPLGPPPGATAPPKP